MKVGQPIAGVILAGGLGRRMGGADKPLVEVGGRPMLARVIERLVPQVERVIINANGDPGRLAGYALPVVPDTIEGFAGPLAGILAGMRWAQTNMPEAQAIVSVAADTPFFPADLTVRLSETCGSAEDCIALAASSGGTHPVFGLWPVALAGTLEAFMLEGNTGKILAFVDRHRRVDVHFPDLPIGDGGVDPFFNVNTPEDAVRARLIAAAIEADVTNPVFGVTGWKNSGKTMLVTRLVTEFSRRGLRVSTIKHAHHDFDIDKPATDSFRHRQAGASEVMIVSGHRWALMHELHDESEPPLEAALQRLSACDLVLIEGYKREGHPKIEARRVASARSEPLAPDDPSIKAVAADHAAETAGRPFFDLDDVAGMADFIQGELGLRRKNV